MILNVQYSIFNITNQYRILIKALLKDIIYFFQIIYSAPAHLTVADGHIEFNLTNSAEPYTTHCSGSSEWLYDIFYGNVVDICDARTGEGEAEGASANFTFSNPAGTFAVNKTWSEPGQGHDERDKRLSTQVSHLVFRLRRFRTRINTER